MPSPDGSSPSSSDGSRLHPRQRLDQLDFELWLFAAILEEDPFHIAALRAHANNLARCGDYRRALVLDRRLVRLQSDKPIPWYNLACSLACLGRTEPALDALERALSLGYPRPDRVGRDPDLRSLKRHPRFQRLLHRSRPILEP
jgi:tetratricopeptide (TPR) repeat protein